MLCGRPCVKSSCWLSWCFMGGRGRVGCLRQQPRELEVLNPSCFIQSGPWGPSAWMSTCMTLVNDGAGTLSQVILQYFFKSFSKTLHSESQETHCLGSCDSGAFRPRQSVVGLYLSNVSLTGWAHGCSDVFGEWLGGRAWQARSKSWVRNNAGRSYPASGFVLGLTLLGDLGEH